VFSNVHKAIRRMNPAPRSRMPKGKVVDVPRTPSEQPVVESEAETQPNGSSAPRKLSLPEMGNATRTSFLRRRSSGTKGSDEAVYGHLKHLGPSNAATRPKSTRINTVKIKPGHVTATPDIPQTIPEYDRPVSEGVITQTSPPLEGGVGEGLLASAGREASDGVHSVAVGYGTMAPNADRMSCKGSMHSGHGEGGDNNAAKPPTAMDGEDANKEDAYLVVDNTTQDDDAKPRSRSVSTIASLRSTGSKDKSPPRRRHTARSGSISENIVDVNGIKKIVLETTSSSDSEEKALLAAQSDETHAHDDDSKGHSEAESSNPNGQSGSKKKRKKRGKKKKGNAGGDNGESQPLLGDGR
jgi:metal transporter CNNM